MGRVKQKPKRSVRVFEIGNLSAGEKGENSHVNSKDDDGNNQDTPFFVDVVDSTTLNSLEHRDISEIVVGNLNLSPELFGAELIDEEFSLRIKLCKVNEYLGRIKLGHWPVLSSENIYLEFIKKRFVTENEDCDVIVCGQFDGSDEAVTGLVHLLSLKFLTLRPVFGVRLSEDVSSIRIRVEILQVAFDVCNSVLDNIRHAWKKSMLSVMGWLRPELTTSEARYGVGVSSEMEVESNSQLDNGDVESSKLDLSGFYEAIKRSKDCPMLDAVLPDLLPELRPYQRRAAYWMVQREKGAFQDSVAWEQSISFSPLCVAVDFLDSCSRMFYNPFRKVHNSGN